MSMIRVHAIIIPFTVAIIVVTFLSFFHSLSLHTIEPFLFLQCRCTLSLRVAAVVLTSYLSLCFRYGHVTVCHIS